MSSVQKPPKGPSFFRSLRWTTLVVLFTAICDVVVYIIAHHRVLDTSAFWLNFEQAFPTTTQLIISSALAAALLVDFLSSGYPAGNWGMSKAWLMLGFNILLCVIHKLNELETEQASHSVHQEGFSPFFFFGLCSTIIMVAEGRYRMFKWEAHHKS